MQYIQQHVRRVVATTKRAKRLHTAALQQSITQMRTGAQAVTTLQARMASRR